jgi:hypothetical protein
MAPTFEVFHPPAAARPVLRAALAAHIRSTAHALQGLAERLAPAEKRPACFADTLPRLEYHADAGAPEGALYVDGALFGHLPGVNRL